MWLHLASNLLWSGTADSSGLKYFGMTSQAGQWSCEGYEFVTCCCPTGACGACAVSKYGSSGITIQATR